MGSFPSAAVSAPRPENVRAPLGPQMADPDFTMRTALSALRSCADRCAADRGGGARGGSTAAPPDATLRPRALRVAALRPGGGVRARAAPCRLTAVQGQLPRGRACMAPSLTFDQLTPLTGRLGAQTLYSWDAGIRPGKERKS